MRFVALIMAAGLAGCVSTAGELRSQSEHQATVTSAENYQAVYKRILTKGRECLDLGGSIASSNKLEGQLYGDLGVGEISYYLDALMDMHFASVKVERAGSGSTVSISTGSQPGWANEKLLKQFKAWAEGANSCQP